MSPRKLLQSLLLLAALTGPAVAWAQTLYAASIRSFANAGSQIVVGNLFTVRMASSTWTLVAPIRLDGNTSVGLTGMAVHPATAAFYAITSGQSPDSPHSLVRLDPVSGDATFIGRLSQPGSDIAFDSLGTLYIWLPGTRQIGTVNLGTGAVTPLGTPGAPSTSGGLAIDAHGIAYITPSGATGTLDSIDIRTGVMSPGPTLTGAPYPGTVNAMTFTPSGLLIAVNSNAGVPQTTQLVSINTLTGVMSALGPLPDDTDAISFAPKPPLDVFSTFRTLSGRVIALLAVVVGSALGLFGYLVWNRFR
jgi:hypothetical protein